MFGFSPWELGIILVIVLIMFGGSRLPQLGRGLGQSLRDFKSALKGDEEEGSESLEEQAKDDHQEKKS
jgi:sec-independent protein translocase protein TatA